MNNSLSVSAAELEGITDLVSVSESTALTSPLSLNTLDQTFTPTKVTVSTVEKLRFTAVVSEQGERGNPQFEYELL